MLEQLQLRFTEEFQTVLKKAIERIDVAAPDWSQVTLKSIGGETYYDVYYCNSRVGTLSWECKTIGYTYAIEIHFKPYQ